MSDIPASQHQKSVQSDFFSEIAARMNTAMTNRDYDTALEMFEEDPIGVWFSIPTVQSFSILQVLVENSERQSHILLAASTFLGNTSAGRFEDPKYLNKVDTEGTPDLAFSVFVRILVARQHGRLHEAVELCDQLEKYVESLEKASPQNNAFIGNAAVQIGVTSMLAGNFARALRSFTKALQHPFQPEYTFLLRNALTKSALIHASFGNLNTASTLLSQTARIPRTSSWAEDQIDAHGELAQVLLNIHEPPLALAQLESINLHHIGELVPFYVLVTHRIFTAAGLQDELEHELEMFESISFPRIDGQGFSGSVIPLKRGMSAMRQGRLEEAETFLARADQRLAYTHHIRAVQALYMGRAHRAVQISENLAPKIQKFRLAEIERLAILAAGHYMAYNTQESLEVLGKAAALPGGLQGYEVRMFSEETRALALEHQVVDWPILDPGSSVFLTNLPVPDDLLTAREHQVLRYLAEGFTRNRIAAEMFISINTLKTHLQSLYRKLDVSNADSAVMEAQHRGLL